MSSLERKMIELSNNSQLTRSCATMLGLNLSEQQLRQLEQWMTHAKQQCDIELHHAKRNNFNRYPHF